MRGERVLRNAQRACDVAGRQTFGLMPNEQPEGLEPRWLRKRGKTGESRFYFHNSRYIEICDGAMTLPAKLRQAHCWRPFALSPQTEFQERFA